jgi:L-iditol 2-dehydrogenase
MKAARLHGVGDVQLHDEPAPQLIAGETLVNVQAVGLCGSDLHWFSEAGIGDARLAHPLILGHEFAGVTASGQRVAIDPAIPCGHCDQCRAGHPNLCTFVRFAGHGETDGALRQQMAWPNECLFPIPDSMTAVEGAMLEPLGIAIHAADLGKIKVGERVGIFGCGPIGLLMLQVARAAGAAEIYATEPLPHRLDAAQELGAKSWHPGQEVDVAFECAGDPGAVDDALTAVRVGGKVILVGIPTDDRTSFSASVARRKGLTIKLSRRMKHTYPRAIRLVASGRVDVKSLVSHRFPLAQTAQAFTCAANREGLKVVVEI